MNWLLNDSRVNGEKSVTCLRRTAGPHGKLEPKLRDFVIGILYIDQNTKLCRFSKHTHPQLTHLTRAQKKRKMLFRVTRSIQMYSFLFEESACHAQISNSGQIWQSIILALDMLCEWQVRWKKLKAASKWLHCGTFLCEAAIQLGGLC